MEFIKALKQRLPRHALDLTRESLFAYSYDATKRCTHPVALVNAVRLEDVTGTIKIARQYKIPVVTRGAGSGLTGGSVPHKNGILLNLERMNRILHIDKIKKIAVIEPGVINADLQVRLGQYGLFFPCDPGSAEFSSIGGNVAENACGMRGRFYGSCYSHVAGIEYIDHEGKSISTGYFNNGQNRILQGLLIGSEGTLGIIVKIALNLLTMPAHFNTYLLFFSKRAHAFEFTSTLLADGLIPYALEFIDGNTFPLIADNRSTFFRTNLGAAVILETSENNGAYETIINGFSEVEVVKAKHSKDRTALWALRSLVSPALYNIAPAKINEDVALPVDKLKIFTDFLDELNEKSNRVSIYTFGHLGAGCFHANFMYNPKEEHATEEAENMVREMLKKTVELNGTISCEHGIGLTKKPFLKMDLGPEVHLFNRNIKRSFDPDNIFNPEKIFED
jgi:FAD/FMN-containing dehydrogenase